MTCCIKTQLKRVNLIFWFIVHLRRNSVNTKFHLKSISVNAIEHKVSLKVFKYLRALY